MEILKIQKFDILILRLEPNMAAAASWLSPSTRWQLLFLFAEERWSRSGARRPSADGSRRQVTSTARLRNTWPAPWKTSAVNVTTA